MQFDEREYVVVIHKSFIMKQTNMAKKRHMYETFQT